MSAPPNKTEIRNIAEQNGHFSLLRLPALTRITDYLHRYVARRAKAGTYHFIVKKIRSKRDQLRIAANIHLLLLTLFSKPVNNMVRIEL
jgi:hypothetical protein